MTASNITLNSASEGWANLNPGAADLIYGWIPKHNMSKKIHSHAFSGHALIIVFFKESDGIFIPPDPAIRLQSEASKL